MAPQKERKRPPAAKFYRDDIVQKVDNPELYGLIARCWHDPDEDVARAPDDPDPLNRALKQGEAGVSWFPLGGRDILPESAFRLVDRSFQPGDFCKRSVDGVISGVVTSIDVQGRLVHSISGEPVEGWKSMNELEAAADVYVGDYVACDDWVGQVIEAKIFDESLVQVASGQLVRLPELTARFAVGDKGDDILPAPGGLFSIFMPRPSNEDTVVAVSHTVVAVAWLAINQSLDAATALARERPQRFFQGEDLSRLRFVRGKVEQMMRVGDRVQFKDPKGYPFTRHGSNNDPNGIMEVRTFTVKETITTVNVIWQDGTHEATKATDLIPYLTIDEYDVWPGDRVLWKTEDGVRPAIIQSVNAIARTASVRLADTADIELVSLLELDAYGSGAAPGATVANFDSLGVRRGDFVFVHAPGTSNGAETGRVPRIGEVPAWVREVPVDRDGKMIGWRSEMNTIGIGLAQTRGAPPTREQGEIKKTEKGDTSFNWLGEVTDLRLDGSVEVTLADATVVVLPLERLTKLYDGMDHIDDLWGDDTSSMDDYSEDEDMPLLEVISEQEPWPNMNGAAEEGEWEDVDDDENMSEDDGGDWAMSEGSDAGKDTEEIPTPPVDSSGTATPQGAAVPIPSHVVSPLRSLLPDASKDAAPPSSTAEADELPWERFEVLAETPVDHAYYTTKPAQPSKNFMSRLTKEYRVLANSLPESIVIRAYEDRADLLRCLIIGPENTPYEDAPFVIDWMLNSDFPQSPPIAHFHSWTNGNGRVNPNLYEEGKVCLSILGTWSGDRNEIWSAARSSLLQAFVSIQGLVLVKEPWFCEPAYEKLRGTEEGIVNSRLYSEKAYVLSRNFVRRALELPVGSLESEIKYLYFTQGKLAKVVREARTLIEKSKEPAPAPEGESGSSDSERAVPRLTEGGIITLDRTLRKLQAILDAPPPPDASS